MPSQKLILNFLSQLNFNIILVKIQMMLIDNIFGFNLKIKE